VGLLFCLCFVVVSVFFLLLLLLVSFWGVLFLGGFVGLLLCSSLGVIILYVGGRRPQYA